MFFLEFRQNDHEKSRLGLRVGSAPFFMEAACGEYFGIVPQAKNRSLSKLIELLISIRLHPW